MSFIVALYLESSPYLQWPGGWLGWSGVFAYVLGLGYFVWKFRSYGKRWEIQEWAIFGGLFVAELILSIFIGVRLLPGQALPAPGSLQAAMGPAFMVFAALPWVLAAGLLGTLASTGLALLSGILLAVFDTHQVFTAFEYMTMGLVMGVAINQRYRTNVFKVLRHPLVVSGGILVVYPGLFVAGVLFGLEGNLLIVLDFALTYLGPVLLQVAGMLFLASIFSEVIAIGMPGFWGRQGKLVPSPGETSLEIGAFYVLGPVVFVMVIVLGGIGWNVANRAARVLLEDRMVGAAEVSAENVPLAVEVGQSLILQFASAPQATNLNGSALEAWLRENVTTFAYFQHLAVFEGDGSYVGSSEMDLRLTMQEENGLLLARQGVPFQFYVLDGVEGMPTASLVFIARVPGDISGSDRVLIGRTALENNVFALNIVHSLDSVKAFDGEGFLVDTQGAIIYHSDPNRILTRYTGTLSPEPTLDALTSSTGTRIFRYTLPVSSQPWTIVVTVPVQAAQRLALQIAAPLLGLLLLLAFVLLTVTRVVMRLVTGSLRTLATEANRIASDKNELATPLQVDGVNEIGQMRQAFEQMRVSLKEYLDEREKTLLVAQIGEERLSAIIESTPDPVLVTDANNRLILANSVAKQVFGNGKVVDNGASLEEVIGAEALIELMKLAEDEVLTREVIMPDGRIYVAKAKSVITDDKLQMGQVCVLRDVTRFKELDALKSDFVTSVSHDLRSPLTLMRGYATMVEMMGQLNDEQKKYLKRIEHGVDRMGHMVNNLLDLGRIESGLLKWEMVSILEIVKQVVGGLQYQAEQKKIELEGYYPEVELPLLKVDPSLLSQAIHNLVENAIKYTEAGGKVKLSLQLEMSSASVLIVVQDTGIGISPADQIRLFEKFYRVPNKKAQVQRGSGLGLAIVKSIVEQHKGRIWVESELDKGSTFFVRLPLEQKVNE